MCLWAAGIQVFQLLQKSVEKCDLSSSHHDASRVSHRGSVKDEPTLQHVHVPFQLQTHRQVKETHSDSDPVSVKAVKGFQTESFTYICLQFRDVLNLTMYNTKMAFLV